MGWTHVLEGESCARSPQILVGRMKIRIWVDRLGREICYGEKRRSAQRSNKNGRDLGEGREGGTATEKSDIKMNWAAVFAALSLSFSLHFLLNQFFSAVVTLSRRPIDSPERKGGGNPIFLFSLRMMCGLSWLSLSLSLSRGKRRKCI